jgi:amino acid transporter
MATLRPPSLDQILRHPSIGHGSDSFEMTSQEENADANLSKPSGTSRLKRIIHSFNENSNPQLAGALKQDLKTYHAQLIALGSAIGTGLFIASGEGLAAAGPIPLLGAFAFVGMTLCPTIFALGEMATLFPYAGGFFEHCRRYTGEAWGGAMGWKFVPHLRLISNC